MPLTDWIVLLFVKPSLVIMAASLVVRCIRRRAAATRHAIWSGAAVAMLLLPVLAVVVPPIALSILPGPDPRAWGAASVVERASGPSTQADSRADGTRKVGPQMAWGDSRYVPSALALVWIVGALVLGLRMARSHAAARRLVRRASPVTKLEVHRTLEKVKESLGVCRRVDLLQSQETPSPAVVGIRRPTILLPVSALEWTGTDLSAALTHETAHILRHDGVTRLLAGVVAALYWTNPLARFVASKMLEESERACDDEVIRTGVTPRSYARLLLQVARLAQGSSMLPGPAMARRSELEGRLRALLDDRLPRRPIARAASLGLACLVLLASVPVAALTLAPQVIPLMDLGSPEPDQLGDAWSAPWSERLPIEFGQYRLDSRIDEVLSGPDSALAERLIAALDHVPMLEEDLIRDRAAWAISQSRGGRLVEPLLDALRSSDWRVRSYAAWALATERDSRAVPLLLSLLDDPVWRMRAMAAHALRESGDRRAESAMTRSLRDPAWQVRVEAVRYLADLRGTELLERIRPYLNDRHVAVRRAAREAFTNS